MLKPQDIVVLLKLQSWANPGWTYDKLAPSLGISKSEIHSALKRCDVSGLYDWPQRRVLKSALWEFLVYGLRYVFPAQPGALTIGLPTAHSAEPLKSLLLVDPEDIYVWPFPEGEIKGQAIAPLYRSVPMAAKNDPQFYAMLSLVDALRVGKARDRMLARTHLQKWLGVC